MKRAVQCAAVCAAILTLVSFSLGKDKAPKPGPMTGTWECVAHGGPNGDMQFTLELEQAKDALTGSVSSPIGSTDISSGTVKKNLVEIHIESPQGNYVLSGKLHKDA